MSKHPADGANQTSQKVPGLMDLLKRSQTVTHCPYKGRADTWSVRVDGILHEDLAWVYPAPLPESEKIAGRVVFYNEKLDIEVDGVLLP